MKLDRRAGRISRRKSPTKLSGNQDIRNVGDYQEPEESPHWDQFIFETKMDRYIATEPGGESAVRLIEEIRVMRRA